MGKAITFVAVALLVGVIALAVGWTGGQGAAKASIERLEVLWPSIMTAPERDRAFLAGLSMTCRLHEKPIDRSAVTACLQAAVVDPDVMLPKGELKADAPKRLNELLSVASGG